MCGRFAALILAAGRSSRMSGFKPLLDLGGVTALERAASVFWRSGIEDVTVVTGHRAPEVSREAGWLGLRRVHNPRHHLGMFSSVQVGVGSLPQGIDGFFILPVDVPLVAYRTVLALRREFMRAPAPVLHPAYGGQRGFPSLVAAEHAAAFLDRGEAGSLPAVMDALGGRNLDVPDEFVLFGMNTDEEYQYALERLVGMTGTGLPGA